jgi:hypothetical protein
MFSLAPVPIKDALQGQADHFSKLVGWAYKAVVVGVALESVEIVHDILAWAKKKKSKKRDRAELNEVRELFPADESRQPTESHSSEPRWVKRLLRVGLMLVVIGVVAEWRCGVKLEDAHDAIHQHDLKEIEAADEKAGDAATSAKKAEDSAKAAGLQAKSANDKADAVEADAKETTERLNTAILKLDMVGPRWQLLEEHKAEFIEALKAYAPQEIFLINCGLTGGEWIEANHLELDLRDFLGKFDEGKNDGAGWVVDDPKVATWNPATWEECTWATMPAAGGGIALVLSDTNDVAAKRSAVDAANALVDELNNKLMITTIIAGDTKLDNASSRAKPGSFWKSVGHIPACRP